MEITTYLGEDLAAKLAYIQQETGLEIEAVIQTAIDRYYNQLQAQKQSPLDSLDRLKQSSFIGSFSADPNLSINSKAIVHEVLEQKK